MNKVAHLLAIMMFFLMRDLHAQTIFVDALKGDDTAAGTVQSPVATLDQAMNLVRSFTGREHITIKVQPGLYLLKDKVVIDKARAEPFWLTIEAVVMPDDPEWLPGKMPVIQSASGNNSQTQFPHAIGFLVAASNVALKGLKFVGNANPDVKYYYPVVRETESLKGLAVSQCYFIGERNSAPIQGGIWAHGAGTHVDHCIFYGAKNALLLFKSISDFSLTHSIIYGAYEAAVWFGPFDSEFEFHNNIVSNCTYFWLRAENTSPKYTFQNSLFTDMKGFMGYYSKNGAIPADKNEHVEKNIIRSGKLILNEVEINGLPHDYLNPTAQSAGSELRAGIFKKP
jgi:hypothetical protein